MTTDDDHINNEFKFWSAYDSVLEFLYRRGGELSLVTLADLTAPATWGCGADYLEVRHIDESLVYLEEAGYVEFEPLPGPASAEPVREVAPGIYIANVAGNYVPAPPPSARRSSITPRGRSLVECGRGPLYAEKGFAMETVIAKIDDATAPQVVFGVPELWHAEPGIGDPCVALTLAGPGGMSGWVRIGRVPDRANPDAVLAEHLETLRGDFPHGTFDTRSSMFAGKDSHRIFGREGDIAFSTHLTFVRDIARLSLVVVHMHGPADKVHYDPLGFEAAKSVLMQDFPIYIPEWRRPVIPQGN